MDSQLSAPQSQMPPKYEPVPTVVMQNQPQALGAQLDPYHAGYNQMQPNYGGAGPSAATAGTTHVTLNMTMQPQDQFRPQLRTWSTSLCGCCEDMPSCCLLTWCGPCYLSCSISPRLQESCCAPFCLSLGGQSVPLVYRTKLRARHGIAGGAIDDCCVSACCHLCVLCQIKRELDYIERSTGQLPF